MSGGNFEISMVAHAEMALGAEITMTAKETRLSHIYIFNDENKQFCMLCTCYLFIIFFNLVHFAAAFFRLTT